jgi:hypothetical protein
MKIRILGSALEDLHAGRQFYENQAEGVGEYFFDAVFADIDSLALYAGIHQKIFGYHRLLAKRFPYAIYDKMDDPNTVIVQRVLDLRQHPQKIKTALA